MYVIPAKSPFHRNRRSSAGYHGRDVISTYRQRISNTSSARLNSFTSGTGPHQLDTSSSDGFAARGRQYVKKLLNSWSIFFWKKLSKSCGRQCLLTRISMIYEPVRALFTRSHHLVTIRKSAEREECSCNSPRMLFQQNRLSSKSSIFRQVPRTWRNIYIMAANI